MASSCSTDSNATSIVLNHIKLTASDEELLSDLVEAIIPKTDSPGAKELNLHLFVMKMLDDCHSEADQTAFLQGLVAAHKNCKSGDAIPYLSALPEEDVFKNILKRRTVQGYLNSEYVMKNKLVYELVPARYDGAVKIDA